MKGKKGDVAATDSPADVIARLRQVEEYFRRESCHAKAEWPEDWEVDKDMTEAADDCRDAAALIERLAQEREMAERGCLFHSARAESAESALRTVREALEQTLVALPDGGGPAGTGYRYCWDECTGDEQDYVKAVREKAEEALSAATRGREGE